MRGDPRRWVETDLPEELRAVLGSAKEDDADDAQLARLRKAVEGAIGPAAFELHAPPPSEPAALSGTPGSSTWANAPQSLPNALPWALTAVAAIGLATLAARWTATATPAAPPAPTAPTAIEVPAAPSAPAPVAPAAPELTPAPQPSVEVPQPQSAPRAPRAPIASRPAAPRPTLAEELASLDRIRSRMHDPAQAALAVRRHAVVFREGALIPERQLLELEIALRTGQTAKAERLSKRMTRENSTFPYRARALKLLADFSR